MKPVSNIKAGSDNHKNKYEILYDLLYSCGNCGYELNISDICCKGCGYIIDWLHILDIKEK